VSQDAAFLGLNLGTTTSGTISERPLPDGTAQDTVILHTHNAFTWAQKEPLTFDPKIPPPPGDLLFGVPPDQLANPKNTMPPALADSTLQVVVQIPHPGAPLPDIVVLGNFPDELPGYGLVSISFRATASGTTPTGQLATLVVSQTGVLGRTPNPIRDGGFTAEVVDIQTHGSAPAAVSSPVTGLSAPAAAAPLPSVDASQASAVDPLFTPPLGDPLAGGMGQ
jgi:hypothetical protein